MLKRSGVSPSKASKEFQQSLLFAEALSNEIKQIVFLRKKKKETIRGVASGNFFRKYRLIHFAASKTVSNWRKLLTTSLKVFKLNKSKLGFGPKLYESVADFYGRNNIPTALPGKRDAKSIKRNKCSSCKRESWMIIQAISTQSMLQKTQTTTFHFNICQNDTFILCFSQFCKWAFMFMYATLKHDVKAKIAKEIWLRYIREGDSDVLLQ